MTSGITRIIYTYIIWIIESKSWNRFKLWRIYRIFFWGWFPPRRTSTFMVRSASEVARFQIWEVNVPIVGRRSRHFDQLGPYSPTFWPTDMCTYIYIYTSISFNFYTFDVPKKHLLKPTPHMYTQCCLSKKSWFIMVYHHFSLLNLFWGAPFDRVSARVSCGTSMSCRCLGQTLWGGFFLLVNRYSNPLMIETNVEMSFVIL